jgi:hypothetical protein
MPARAFLSLQYAVLAREAKDANAEKQALELARQTTPLLLPANPDHNKIVEITCNVLDGADFSDESRAEFEARLAAPSIYGSQRCEFEYLLGRTLEMRGDREHAAEYYRRAIDRFFAFNEMATLAGIRLHAMEKEAAAAK